MMKQKYVLALSLLPLITSSADAVVVQLDGIDLTDSWGGNLSGNQNNRVFDFVSGGASVSVRVSLLNASGEVFSTPGGLDELLGVGVAGDGNAIDIGEDVTFRAALSAVSGNVDLNTITFRIHSLGLLSLDPASLSRWSSNNNLGKNFSVPVAPVTPDDPVHAHPLTNSDPYEGTLDITEAAYLLTDGPVGTGGFPGGVGFTVEFDTIPEPGTMLLAAFGGLLTFRRRRG